MFIMSLFLKKANNLALASFASGLLKDLIYSLCKLLRHTNEKCSISILTREIEICKKCKKICKNAKKMSE